MDGDDDDSESEAELLVDSGGRTVLDSTRGKFDYSTRVWDHVIPASALPQLVADCARAYLKVKTTTRHSKITYETNATYWVGADAAPQTAIEQLVLDIFRFHTRGHAGEFNVARSGAEWWTQVVDEEREIGFHWDRDYELQREQGLCVHPHLGTVTYLTGVGGAPTVVLPAASPLDAQDVVSACRSQPLRCAHACWPVQGRHLTFDGRLLHGAPAVFAARSVPSPPAPQNARAGANKRRRSAAEAGDGSGGDGDGGNDASPKRVTLLVNVWLNHIPSGADPLHDAVKEQVARAPRVRPEWTRPCRAVVRRVPPQPGKHATRHDTDQHVWQLCGFGQEVASEGTLTLALPRAPTAWARATRAAAGSFLRVEWANGSADLS